jgi:uncharacterized membrane protein
MKQDKILADRVNEFVGSGKFILGQSAFLFIYVLYQSTIKKAFDPFPFILLNLLLSFQAAYTGPFVLWSQNRAAERDRKTMRHIEVMAEQIKALSQRNIELEQKILNQLKMRSEYHG